MKPIRPSGFPPAGSFARHGWSIVACTWSLVAASVSGHRSPTNGARCASRPPGVEPAKPRTVILGYYDDGPNVVTMAMNGWADDEPAWWLNLQAHPVASVDLVDGRRMVRGRAAEGEERSRLWDRWLQIDSRLDDFAALRTGETAVVILEPWDDAAQ